MGGLIEFWMLYQPVRDHHVCLHAACGMRSSSTGDAPRSRPPRHSRELELSAVSSVLGGLLICLWCFAINFADKTASHPRREPRLLVAPMMP